MTPGRRNLFMNVVNVTPQIASGRRWLTVKNFAGAVAMLAVAYLLLLLTTNLSP